MSVDFDPYRILGVGRGVSLEQLRTAARQRGRLAHPDFGGSQEKVAEVNLATEVLSDAAARQAYDQYQMNPTDPAALTQWTSAMTAAKQRLMQQPADSLGSEVAQFAARMEQSHGVRVLAGAIMGLLIGGGVGAAGAMYTSLSLWIGIAIGGGVGLLGGAWASASNSAWNN